MRPFERYDTAGSGRPSSQVRPVSSLTSRTSQSSSLSPERAFPLGKLQSSYFGRCTIRTCGSPPSCRTTTPPAARMPPLSSRPALPPVRASSTRSEAALPPPSLPPRPPPPFDVLPRVRKLLSGRPPPFSLSLDQTPHCKGGRAVRIRD